MSYEQDEPYVVNDEGGEYIAQTPTEESARNHLVEYFTHQDAVLEHIGTGNNATIDLIIAVAEFDLEHPDLYKFHPTAEWSRITQALKERDELAAERDELKRIVNEIWGMFYGQGLSVANWHQNGDLEPMEEFFEQNDWDPESCRAANEKGENDAK